MFTADGIPFTPSHAVNHGRRYRYYVERSLLTPEAEKVKSGAPQLNDSGNGVQMKGWRLPAHEIEQLVLKRLAGFLRARAAVLNAVGVKRKSPNFISVVLARASKLAFECASGSFAGQMEIVSALVRRVTIAQKRVTIEINHASLIERLLDREATSQSSEKDHPPILIEAPTRFRRRGVEAKLVVLDQQRLTNAPDTNLVRALTRAHEWFGRIVRGEASGVGDIARAERLDRSYVTRVLCLAFLAPDLTEAILQGSQPTELTAKQVIASALDIPPLWSDQRKRFPCPIHPDSGHAQGQP